MREINYILARVQRCSVDRYIFCNVRIRALIKERGQSKTRLSNPKWTLNDKRHTRIEHGLSLPAAFVRMHAFCDESKAVLGVSYCATMLRSSTKTFDTHNNGNRGSASFISLSALHQKITAVNIHRLSIY